ncbi:MAG: helix-turn-helix domain-containing protein [Richelia sp. RM2_1_2]|nr:helix-turn-helix domain-containing protein [Richelia sp. RM2_1_2]
MGISKEKIDEIINLHSQGLTNRKIAQQCDVHHNTISYHLKKKGLISNWTKNEDITYVDLENARCKKCLDVKPLDEFQHGRKGQQYEYKYSYCKSCRKKQIYLNSNKSIESQLRERFNRLKRRSKKSQILFDIRFQDFCDRFHEQQDLCFYSKEKLETVLGEDLKRNSISVDKIIPENGYVKNNFVFCTYKANTIKNDCTLDEMKIYLPHWYGLIIDYFKVAKGYN